MGCEVESPDSKSGEVDDWLVLLEYGETNLDEYGTAGPLQFNTKRRRTPIIPPARSDGPDADKHTLPLRSQEGSALSWAFSADMERDVECAIRETWGLRQIDWSIVQPFDLATSYDSVLRNFKECHRSLRSQFYIGVTRRPRFRFYECSNVEGFVAHSAVWRTMTIIGCGPAFAIGKCERQLIAHCRSNSRLTNIGPGGERVGRGSHVLFIYVVHNCGAAFVR